MMLQVVRRLIHNQEAAALQTMRQVARAQAGKANHATQALRRWMASGLASGFDTWREQARLALRQYEMCNRALFNMQGGEKSKLHRWFRSWRMQLSDAEAGSGALVQAAAGFAKATLRAAWLLFSDNTLASARAERLGKRASIRLLNPKLAAAISTWRITAAEMIRARALLAATTMRWLGGTRSKVLLKWREVTSQAATANRLWFRVMFKYQKTFAMAETSLMMTAGGRWKRSEAARVLHFFIAGAQRRMFGHWRHACTAVEIQKALMQRSMRALARSKEVACLKTWREAAVIAKAEQKVAKWASHSWKNRGLNAAWNSWITHWTETLHQQQLIRAAGARMLRAGELVALRIWRRTAACLGNGTVAGKDAGVWWLKRSELQAVVLWRVVANNNRLREATGMMSVHHWNTRARRKELLKWRLANWKDKSNDRQRQGWAARALARPRREPSTVAHPSPALVHPGGVSRLKVSLDGPIGRKIRSGFFASRSQMTFPNGNSMSTPVEDETSPTRWPARDLALEAARSPQGVFEDEAAQQVELSARRSQAKPAHRPSDEVFDLIDGNNDGVVSRDEFVAAYLKGVFRPAAGGPSSVNTPQTPAAQQFYTPSTAPPSVASPQSGGVFEDSQILQRSLEEELLGRTDARQHSNAVELLNPAQIEQLRALFTSYCPPGIRELSLPDWRMMTEVHQLPQQLDLTAAFIRAVPRTSARPALEFSAWLELLRDIAKVNRPLDNEAQALAWLVDDYLSQGPPRTPQVPSPSPVPDSAEKTDITKFCTLHGFPDEASKLHRLFQEYSLSSDSMTRAAFEDFLNHCGAMGPSLSTRQVGVIFHSAAQSKEQDAELTVQQFLRTFAMLAVRVCPGAQSYMAGTKDFLTKFVFNI